MKRRHLLRRRRAAPDTQARRRRQQAGEDLVLGEANGAGPVSAVPGAAFRAMPPVPGVSAAGGLAPSFRPASVLDHRTTL